MSFRRLLGLGQGDAASAAGDPDKKPLVDAITADVIDMSKSSGEIADMSDPANATPDKQAAARDGALALRASAESLKASVGAAEADLSAARERLEARRTRLEELKRRAAGR